MAELNEFMAVYEEFAQLRPLYMSFKEITTGIPRWRLHVFERGTAPTGGDMEILFIEDPDKAECLRRGIKTLKERVKVEQKAEKEAV